MVSTTNQPIYYDLSIARTEVEYSDAWLPICLNLSIFYKK